MAAADATHLIIFLILPILPFLFFTFLIKRRSSSPKPPLPPGPRPWPIVGNLPHIGTKPHIVFAKLAQRHGPLISLRLGTQLVVVASSPAAAAEILRTHDRFLSGRHVPQASYAKNPDKNRLSFGWTFECNEHWKLLRTVCRTQIFGAKAVDGQAGIREKKADELVGFLSSKEGEAVRLAELVFVGVLNFMGTIFFSKEFIRLEESRRDRPEMNGHVRRLAEVLGRPNLSDFYPLLGELDLQGLRKKVEDATAQICGAWEEILRERRRRGGDSTMPAADFLGVLLDNGFTDAQINYLFLELFVAGTDTSTSTIEWAMAELMRNPEAMQKLREELDQQIPTGDAIRESHLHSLSYLHACVKETLRLHPAAPLLLPRSAAQSCQVMGFTIPRKAQVFVNVWAMGRDPTIWENPLVFKPERFLDSSLDFRGNDFEFLPFGGGRRICAGLLMAIRQIHLTLANLVYQFEWSLPDNTFPQQLDMSEKFGVLLEKEHPLVVIPRRRR